MTLNNRRDVAGLNEAEAAPPARRQPQQPASQYQAIQHLKAGRLDEATAIFEHIVAEDPENWQSLHLLGLIAYRLGDLPRAAGLIRHCLSINPNLAEGFSDLGVVLKDMDELDDAQAACEKAIALKPNFHPAHSNLGNIFKAMGRLEDAADCYVRAIEYAPSFADAYANLGATLAMMGKTEDALAACRCAVDLAPNHAEARIAYGHALRAAGRIEEAMDAYRQAIALKPDHGPVHSDLGCLLQQQGQLEEALKEHRLALELKPDAAESHSNLGIALKELGRLPDALACYKAAIKLKPNYADAHSNMGVVLDLMRRHGEAADAYRRAIEINPKLNVAYINLAGSLWEQNQIGEAISNYAKALEAEPDQAHALVDCYHVRRHACDWDGLSAIEERILGSTYRKGKRVPSFPILNVPCGAEDHLLSARSWVGGLKRPLPRPFSHGPIEGRRADGRLRIGYLSADYYGHATASLIAEMIERHERSRFEIFGYCFSRDDGSEVRRRLMTAFDRFVLIRHMPHAEAAQRIYDDKIDILIDLKGYTMDARTEILTCRPAPIQVNYLGYPGTMGADFIDYVVADSFILPMDQQPFFDEKIVHLPGCYQPNDTKRAIADATPSRRECGLPENGVVFCCFNNTYKITPDVFAVWMRILKGAPGSVIWLLEANTLVRQNLQRQAREAGVDPARLVFAPRMKLPDHLARHRLADLFLDTLPVNAHTTASDALWAGLPILTCAGETFVSRVCGSLLQAVGLSDLITYSLDEYEDLALNLARSPARLTEVRERLARNRNSAPLFDIERYTRGLEAAYGHMAEIYAEENGPRGFTVAEMHDSPSAQTASPPAAMPQLAAAAPSAAWTPMNPLASSAARIPYDVCPACGGADLPIIKDADCTRHPGYGPGIPVSITWRQCSACKHVFSSGYFTPEAHAAILAKSPPHRAVGHDLEAQRVLSARIVSRIAKLMPSGDWLDAGFGNASLLFTAAEWGYRPVGIDPRPASVEALVKLGCEAYRVPIEELDTSGRFSVISLSDLLTHVPYPRTALTAAYRLLKPGGALLCSAPNRAAMVWRILDETGWNPYWGELEHYHQFTFDGLCKLLDEHGFRPVEYNISERIPAGMDVLAVKS
jgi:predicted O-linked N-acetylglucosamine transferase (SPINDLY family)/SAM-dependent methyltransferase